MYYRIDPEYFAHDSSIHTKQSLLGLPVAFFRRGWLLAFWAEGCVFEQGTD